MSAVKLPDGWVRVKLGDVAVNSTAVSSNPIEDGYERYVLGKDIPDGGTVETWGEVGDGHFGSRIRTRIEAGDVICTTRGPNLRVARATFRALGAHTNFVLRTANKNVMLQDFLALIAESAGFQAHLVRNFRGSVNLFVNWSDAARYEFALPPIKEQQRIATLLTTVDRASDSNACLAQSAGDLADAVRHSEIERDYEGPTRTLGVTVSIGLGRVYPSDAYRDDGVLLLRPGNISASGRIDWTRGRTHLPRRLAEERGTVHVAAGDIIMNLTAQSLEDGFLGRVCMAGEGDESILNQRIARLRSGEHDPPYLFLVLQHQRFRRTVDSAAKGSKIKHLYERDLVGFPVPVPGLERQLEVVARVDTARRVADGAGAAAASLRLMGRMLREDLLAGGDGHVQ